MSDNYGKTNLQPGFRLLDGSAINELLSRALQGGLSRQDTITAHAGGTKAAAYVLTKSFSRISTCATAGDSVLLPKAIAGSAACLVNDGAAALAFYGKGSDTVDGIATANPSYVAPGDALFLVCLTAGAWNTVTAPGVVEQQTLAAAGASQGNAALITGKRVIVTVTASTQGVKLPVGFAGREIEVYAAGTVGVKVYPGSGAKIGATSTNGSRTLAADKAAKYVAISATQWRVLTGA